MSSIVRFRITLGLTCSLALLAPVSAHGQSYSMTDLGTGGGECSAAAAINNSGHVVGSTNTGPIDDGTVSPFVYRNGAMTLITPAYGYAAAINDAGHVTGFACREPGPCFITRAFLHDNRRLKFLGGLHGPGVDPSSQGYGINSADTIVGQANEEGVVFFHGAVLPFGFLGVHTFTAINDSNWAIGSLENNHAFLFNGHALRDLGTLDDAPDSNSRPRGINAAGQVVGSSYMSTLGTFHAYSFEDGVISDIGTLHPDGIWFEGVSSYSYANGINTAGDIVGESDGAAFLYRNGVMTDLNSLLTPDSPHVGWASGINDSGQIVGLVWTSPCGHAVLLTPVTGSAPQ
jgi:probable HAF family extracellular repeat protein